MSKKEKSDMSGAIRNKKILRNDEKPKKEVHHCRKCKKNYTATERYYMATNPHLDTSGRMSVCKDCCKTIFQENLSIHKDYSRAIYETCFELDIVYNKNTFDATYDIYIMLYKSGRSTDFNFFGTYMSRLTNMYTDKQTSAGFRFKDSDPYKFDSQVFSENQDVVVSEEDLKKSQIDKDAEKMEKYKEEWGENHDIWEYKFLENELFKLQSSFECSDYGMTMIMRDICFINLSIEKERRKGNDAQKLIESRSKLMADAKMKPVQASGIESNDAITFGTLIKKYENERPIPVHMDDEMKLYIDTFMVGQLAKMEGLRNEYVDKADKELESYSVDFSILDEGEEDVEMEE